MLTKNDQEMLIKMNYTAVYYYCLSCIKDKEAAKDVTQETFKVMVQKAETLTNDNMSGWIMSTAKRLCKAYLRKYGWENGCLRLDGIESEVLNQIFAKMDDRSFGVYYETYQAIMLQHLSAKEAYLCELRFIKGLSSTKIAALLQINEAAVNTRVSRLKKKMEKIIREDIPFI